MYLKNLGFARHLLVDAKIYSSFHCAVQEVAILDFSCIIYWKMFLTISRPYTLMLNTHSFTSAHVLSIVPAFPVLECLQI